MRVKSIPKLTVIPQNVLNSSGRDAGMNATSKLAKGRRCLGKRLLRD